MATGFIGLGNLGTVMANNLIASGREIHLYNRTLNKMQPYEGKAELHSSVASIAVACDIIISILSNDAAVEDITFNNGLLDNMKPGGLHVCLSTIAASTATKLHHAYNRKELDYVTATIIGRPEAAAARALTVCISGTTTKKEEVQGLLADLGGKNFFHFGDDPATAAAIKICNNFLIIAAIEAMGEAFNLAEKSGADKTAFYQMITSTIFNAPIYKNYGKIIIEEAYENAGFTSLLGLKDTKLALQLAEEYSAPLPLGDLIKNHFIVNHNRGRKDFDWTSIAKVISEDSKNV